MQELADENKKRFIAVLNKKVETGRLMNALGHMAVGFIADTESTDEFCFLDYKDKDGNSHPNISHYPFIVLKADNSNKIRTVRNECIARGIKFSDFTSTMTVGTSTEQQATTKNTSEAELDYWGILMFGNTEELKEFTGKFSLYK